MSRIHAHLLRRESSGRWDLGRHPHLHPPDGTGLRRGTETGRRGGRGPQEPSDRRHHGCGWTLRSAGGAGSRRGKTHGCPGYRRLQQGWSRPAIGCGLRVGGYPSGRLPGPAGHLRRDPVRRAHGGGRGGPPLDLPRGHPRASRRVEPDVQALQRVPVVAVLGDPGHLLRPGSRPGLPGTRPGNQPADPLHQPCRRCVGTGILHGKRRHRLWRSWVQRC